MAAKDQPEPSESAHVASSGSAAGASVTKRDRITAELRRMIANGQLPRGSRIQQDELAEMFSTSITPVREAMRLLEAEGVLIAAPHRGVRVAEADYEQVKTAYLARRLLEPYAMRRAARRLSPRDVDLADRLTKEMEAAAKEGDRTALNNGNQHFHFLFYEKCGNDGLTAEIGKLWQRFPWDVLQVLPDRAGDTSHEHRQIMAAVRAGDIETVGRATEEHISRSFMSLATYLTGRPVADPFEIDND